MSQTIGRRHARLPAGVEYLREHVGVEVSSDTLRRMVERGDLTGYRMPGSRLLFVDLDELDQLMQPVNVAAAS